MAKTALSDGDRIEIVHFCRRRLTWTERLTPRPRTTPGRVAGRTFTSRLIVGTGKYKDYAQNAAAAEASGAEIVTVALRRVNLSDPSQQMLVDYVKPDRFTYLPEHRRLLHRRGGGAHCCAWPARPAAGTW